MRYFN